MNTRFRWHRPITLSGALPWVLLYVGLLTATVVYYPGLSGPFMFDDIFNIVINPQLWLNNFNPSELHSAAFSTNTGPLQRPLSMASFALNLYFFGEGVTSFKVVNLAIHLINGLLIFLLARGLLRLAVQRHELGLVAERAGITAALIAGLWLVHPINLTSVLYVVQRMTSLSGLFVLLALLTYLQGRLLLIRRRRMGIALFGACLLFWVCGLASKENALLLPWYVFLIEWLFLYPRSGSPDSDGQTTPARSATPPYPRRGILVRSGSPDPDGQTTLARSATPPYPRRGILTLFSSLLPMGEGLGVRVYTWAWFLVPLIGGLLYLAFHPGMLNHDFRPFTLTERVLTETRVLWFYLGLMVLPRHEALGLYHDDFPLSVGLLTPWTTLPAILGLVLLAGFAVRIHRTQPLLAFGILFFFAAHALESSIFPLEIMHEHRNYLASFGMLFGSAASLIMREGARWHFQLKARLVLVGIFFMFLSAITFGQALDWRNFSYLMLRQAAYHPESVYANNDAGRLYLYLREETDDVLKKQEFTDQAVRHFLKTAELLPQDAAGLLTTMYAQASFAEATDERIVEDALRRLRSGKPSDLSVRALLVLNDCERAQQCAFPAGWVETLLQAVLDNPRLGQEARATLFDAAMSRAMSAQRFNEAEALFQQSLAHSDNALYRISYATMLAHLNRRDEAQEQVRQALASPQPANIVKMAEDLQRRIAQGSDAESSNALH